MTLTVLENYLAEFKGCVIVVSHDRFFLDRIVDHLFVMKGDGEVRDFPGDYSTYRHCVKQEEKEKRAQEETKKSAASATAPTASAGKQKTERKPKLTFKEKKEMEMLEAELEDLGNEKSELETAMSSGTMTVDEITAAAARMEQVISRLDEAEMRMLELMDKE